ncbi:MAG TPA: MTAP family purine nucleoside phosphorylase [Tepidisphaeraceae bacterium]|nr:MTAP family purine nucleoside phosphorylase [Tepidisphaeraceae bacterium]
MSELKVGLIGGSGLGEALGAEAGETRRHEVDTPFGRPSDAIVETRWADVPVFVLSRHGPGHTIPPSQLPFRANVFALKQLGVTHVIASGAVGSLREEFRPRDLVVPDQVIDKTLKRTGTFYEKAAVHVEFAEPFCPVLRRILLDAGRDVVPDQTEAAVAATTSAIPTAGHKVHDRGCYVCMEGPAFSTRAESLMHRLWGGDLVGMTAMPEAKLAKEAEISYALVALVTDYDSWRAKPAAAADQPHDPFALLSEIIGHLKHASANAIALMRRAVELLAERRDQAMTAPARDALKLGIWSDKRRIDPDEVRRLWPLWGKYFEEA